MRSAASIAQLRPVFSFFHVDQSFSPTSLTLFTCPPPLQTKGVRAVVKIETETGAWIAAVGAVGASIIGCALVWPIMKRYLRKYDEAQIKLPATGDAVMVEAGGSRFKDVEEDG
jgi:hypothetical protein